MTSSLVIDFFGTEGVSHTNWLEAESQEKSADSLTSAGRESSRPGKIITTGAARGSRQNNTFITCICVI